MQQLSSKLSYFNLLVSALIFAAWSVYMPGRLKRANIYSFSLPCVLWAIWSFFVLSFILHYSLAWLAIENNKVQLWESALCWFSTKMDSDSDSPFNYSWPSLPKMRIRRRASKPGRKSYLLLNDSCFTALPPFHFLLLWRWLCKRLVWDRFSFHQKSTSLFFMPF